LKRWAMKGQRQRSPRSVAGAPSGDAQVAHSGPRTSASVTDVTDPTSASRSKRYRDRQRDESDGKKPITPKKKRDDRDATVTPKRDATVSPNRDNTTRTEQSRDRTDWWCGRSRGRGEAAAGIAPAMRFASPATSSAIGRLVRRRIRGIGIAA